MKPIGAPGGTFNQKGRKVITKSFVNSQTLPTNFSMDRISLKDKVREEKLEIEFPSLGIEKEQFPSLDDKSRREITPQSDPVKKFIPFQKKTQREIFQTQKEVVKPTEVKLVQSDSKLADLKLGPAKVHVIEREKKQIQESAHELDVETYKGVKTKYNYNIRYTPVLDYLNVVLANEKLTKREQEEERGFQDVAEAFGFSNESKEKKIEATKFFENIRHNLESKPSNYTRALENIYEIMKLMNPIERGKILVNMIFGDLISKDKLPPSKSSIENYIKKLVDETSKLTINNSGSLSKLYEDLDKVIKSDKLNAYRTNESYVNKFKNLTNLITKLKTDELPIYFPFETYNGITINGKITKADLIEFFTQTKAPVKVESNKAKRRNIINEREDDYHAKLGDDDDDYY